MYLNVNMEGRMVNDPEFKSGKNGREFVTFRMVVNQYAGGEENATFISCTGGEDIASRMKKVTLKKGRLLHLSGELAEHHYTNRDGIDRTSLDLSINDGQPNDDGYSGSAAEADLRGIKMEFSRKGVDIFAAAIGDDKEKIERIYGSGFHSKNLGNKEE